MSEKRQYSFIVDLPSGQRITVSVKARNPEEAERLMWRKVAEAGLDTIPNPHAEKGLPQ